MKRDYRRKVLRHYNRAASSYDKIEFIRKGTRLKVLDYGQVKSGDKVLDVCTGTGELALAFARQGAEVTGIDIADKMLLRAAAKSNGFQTHWVNMDATNLEFEDKAFDISTVSLALHHMPEKTQHQVLSELARVTDRVVIIVEPHQPYKKYLHRAWGFVASIVDESEYMRAWVRQDFDQTCENAGLCVEAVEVTTLAIHRITVCKPMV